MNKNKAQNINKTPKQGNQVDVFVIRQNAARQWCEKRERKFLGMSPDLKRFKSVSKNDSTADGYMFTLHNYEYTIGV